MTILALPDQPSWTLVLLIGAVCLLGGFLFGRLTRIIAELRDRERDAWDRETRKDDK